MPAETHEAVWDYETLPNSDMAFNIEYSKTNPSSLPSPLLLHYRYGVTALQIWGRGLSVLDGHKYDRPESILPVLRLPTIPRTTEDRRKLLSKREHPPRGGSHSLPLARALTNPISVDSLASQPQGALGVHLEDLEGEMELPPEDLEGQIGYPQENPLPRTRLLPYDLRDETGLPLFEDTEDFVMALWSSTPYARAKLQEEENAARSRVEKWRRGD
jgi:hypothetical protein